MAKEIKPRFTLKSVDDIFSTQEMRDEEKANQKEKLKLPMDNLRKYFPKRYTPEEIEAEIMKMLEDRYRRRQNERDER